MHLIREYTAAVAIIMLLGAVGVVATKPISLRTPIEKLSLIEEGSTASQERFVARVPEDFPTIQAAVDAVAEGGTVLIGPGMYKENVQIKKSLRLVGAGQERVQIRYKDPYHPIIHVVSEDTVQLHLQDLTIGDPTFPIEQVIVPLTPTSPMLSGIGLQIFGPVQTLLRRVTVGGLLFGVVGLWTYEDGARLSPQIILEEANLVRNGTGLESAQLLVIRSKIEENLAGISSDQLFLSRSLVSKNRFVGIILGGTSNPFARPQFMGSITDNEFRQNGVGIYLGGKVKEDWITIANNRFVQNERYGVAIADPACPIDPELPLPKSSPIQIFGGSNEFHNNGQDLCPADYPWPPGFRK